MKVFTTVAARAHTAAPDDVHTHEARASAPAPAGQTRVHIEAFAAADEWQQFVRTADDATFFHSAAWKAVLEEAFGFQTHFLLARRAGAVVGVAPLCELRPLFGKPRLLSLPFAVEAGVSAVDDDVRRGLENAAVDRARTLGARYLELRDGGGGEAFHLRGDTYCRFRHRLSPTDEDNFARIPRKRRRMIRRAQASGLQVRVGADLDIFYRLYAESQRRLGSPLLPRMYFATLLRHFGEDVVVLTVWHAATPVASVFSFIFRDSILPYYAGSRRAPAPCGSNDFMYWELMRLACRRGLTTFDFGRSRRGSGAFDYKRHWGFEPQPLCYRVHALGHEAPQRRTVDDPRLRLLRWGWQRVPLAVTMRLGPLLARHCAPYFT